MTNINPFQARGSAIERRDATTGHSVTPIAFCQSPEVAADIMNALTARDTLRELLCAPGIPDGWANKARQRIANLTVRS